MANPEPNAIFPVTYGICYVIRGKVIFFTVGKGSEEKRLEDCKDMNFVPCPIPDQIIFVTKLL